MDRITPSDRSRLMSRVRGKNTRPELRVRSLLHRLGFRFRLHRRDLPGRPDLVLAKYRAAIFVHGCFWHGHSCSKGRIKPSSNVAFWQKKLSDNQRRDARKRRELEAAGWKVITIWECETANETELARRLSAALRGRDDTDSSKVSPGRAE